MSLFDRLRRRRVDDRSMPSEADGDVEPVEGERGVSAVQRPPSLQSRLSNLLALGLMGSLGVGLLGWYYVHSFGTRSNARMAAQSAAQDRAKGEVNVRPLGRVDPPVDWSAPSASAPPAFLGGPPEPPPNNPPGWP